MVLEVMQREIATRGIGYLVLRDCPEDRLGEALSKGMEKLKHSGAKTVWATSLPEGAPLNPGPVGVWRLTHVHDLVSLERSLSDRPKASGEVKLTFRPVKRSADEKLYLELVNRSYADVPNAKTLRQTDLRAPNHRSALAFQGETAVGAYEWDLNEKTPELVTLAVLPEFRRQGMGRAILRTAMEGLKTAACCVTVSTANRTACASINDRYSADSIATSHTAAKKSTAASTRSITVFV